MQSSQMGFQCPHPGCKKSYTWKYGLKEHLKSAHDVVDTNSFTRNFKCPFSCGAEAYKTYRELLHHCDKQHQDLLCKMLIVLNSCMATQWWMCGRREVGEGTSDHSNFGCMLVALVMRNVLFVSVFSLQPCY